MPEGLFRGIVKAGSFVPDNPARLDAWLRKAEGKRVVQSLRRESGRTLPQLRFYWGYVLTPISEWSGHDPEELHEHFKGRFLPVIERTLPNGEHYASRPSTSALSEEQMGEYLQRVIRWAALEGIEGVGEA